MVVRRTLLSGLLLASLGCTPRSPVPSRPVSAAGANPAVRQPIADASSVDTLGCGFVSRVAHPTAHALLVEFVRRAATGEFAGRSVWLDGAMTCAGHEPGSDEAMVADDPRLVLVTESDTLVRAVVTWRRLGLLQSGGQFVAAGGTHSDTLAAVKTAYGWRVRSPLSGRVVPPGQLKSVR